MMDRAEVNQVLKDLRLPGIRSRLDEILIQAEKNSMGYLQFLGAILEAEDETRRINRTDRLLKHSRIPLQKNLESFEIGRLNMKVQQQIRTLLDGGFLSRAENVLAFGNPGTGKTHLMCAIGQELIHQGRAVLFLPYNLLVQDLLRSKQALGLEKFLRKLARYDAIIIDDIGYVQQNKDEMEVLFAFIAHRYERSSLLITSNLAFSSWDKIFKDTMTTAAAIDRLVHHCVILEMNCESYRIQEAKAKKKLA